MESGGSLQWNQCLAAFASSLMFYPAVDAVWFSLMSTKRYFEIIYLLSSVILVICGAILAAVCSDFYGRKKTMLASSFFTLFRIARSLDYYLSENSFEILFFIHLFHVGFTSTTIPLYILEVTATNIHQIAMVLPLVNLIILQLIAVLFGNVVDSLEPHSIAFSVCIFVATLFYIIILSLCPETPYYLNWREKYKETEKSLSFYTRSRYVRTEEPTPEPCGNSQVTRFAQEWNQKLRAITEMKNIHSLCMIFVLVSIKWGIGQRHDESIILAVMSSLNVPYEMLVDSSSFDLLIVIFATTIFIIFMAFAISLLSMKISLLAAIVISFVATLIKIWMEDPVILFILIFVKYSGYLIFTGITWSSVGVLFSTNVKAIVIAIVVSFEMLIGTTVSWIEYMLYQEDRDYPWYLHVPPGANSYVDMGALILAFTLVLLYIPKTIKAQPEKTFQNYAVVRAGG